VVNATIDVDLAETLEVLAFENDFYLFTDVLKHLAAARKRR
jgi:hypothetical protein